LICEVRSVTLRDYSPWAKQFLFIPANEDKAMSVTLKQARIIADATLSKSQELGLKPLSVVVLDPRTSVVISLSEDGCSQMRQRIALGKAKAAIQLGLGTRALMARAEQQAYFIQCMNGLADGEFVPVPGGVLLRDANGKLIGAVGVSGDTSDNDEAAALAGIASADLIGETG
jgi:uncharacterized protein GlcG (DUF336 family)